MALFERVRGRTIAGVLATRATTDPGHPFIVFQDQTLSYGQVDIRSDALAASLSGFGVGPGDRIALVLPAWPEFVISMFAASKVGATILPINPRVTGPELHYMLRHSQAAVAITVETFHGVDYLSRFEDLLLQLPDLRYLITVGAEDLWYDDRIFQFEDALSAGEGRDYTSVDVDPAEATCALVYTAGTTGKPKGVELTHANLLDVAASAAEGLGLTSEDVVIGVHGLFHVFGLGAGILGTLAAGATLILQDEFDGAATLDLIERRRATVQLGLPTLLTTEVHEQRARPRDLSSLRAGLVAGGPVSTEALAEARSNLCQGLEVAYSLTETASVVTMTRPEDPASARLQTVGRPLSGVRFKVVSPDGLELPVESVGEVVVAGPGLMKGYYRQPAETSASLDTEGFFRTGDLGMIDEDGFIHLVGRRKEVIIRSGFSVHPREVEERLQSHPAVQSAAVVGIPDEFLGEAVFACVVPVEGAIVNDQDLRGWCDMTLADYKVPDEVRFMDALPLTGTGKVRRVALVEQIRSTTAQHRTSDA